MFTPIFQRKGNQNAHYLLILEKLNTFKQICFLSWPLYHGDSATAGYGCFFLNKRFPHMGGFCEFVTFRFKRNGKCQQHFIKFISYRKLHRQMLFFPSLKNYTPLFKQGLVGAMCSVVVLHTSLGLETALMVSVLSRSRVFFNF